MTKSLVVGVAGCGSMGLPMAQALRHAGYEVWGLDVRLADEFDRLTPLFQAMGQHLFRLGPSGAGMTAKVLNNYVACASVVAVRRAYARARELGADWGALRSVMMASSGSTWFGDHFHEIDWSREGYETNNTIGILEKDVLAGLDAMRGAERAGPDAFDAALLEATRAIEPFDAEPAH